MKIPSAFSEMSAAECCAANGGLQLNFNGLGIGLNADLGDLNIPDVPGTVGGLVIQVSALAGQLLASTGAQVGSLLGNLSL